MCCCIVACVLHCREQRCPIDSSIIPGWKEKHTRCAVPEQNTHTCRFCWPKSKASPAPAVLHSWDLLWFGAVVQSFRVQEPNHQGSIWEEHLIPWHANYAHGERCWGKRKKAWNFHWLQVMLPKAISEDECSNEAQSRQPFLGLPQPPHPFAQILAAQHHLGLHQQGVQGRKTWGIFSFYFLLFPSLWLCAFSFPGLMFGP